MELLKTASTLVVPLLIFSSSMSLGNTVGLERIDEIEPEDRAKTWHSLVQECPGKACLNGWCDVPSWVCCPEMYYWSWWCAKAANHCGIMNPWQGKPNKKVLRRKNPCRKCPAVDGKGDGGFCLNNDWFCCPNGKYCAKTLQHCKDYCNNRKGIQIDDEECNHDVDIF